MATLKSAIGAHVLPLLPFNRRAVDMLRYEFTCAQVNAFNALSPFFHARVAQLRKRRDLSINLGSGGRGHPNWVNVELRRQADTSICLDLRRKLPFASESAQRVFAEHVLEHLDFSSDAPRLLGEVYRVLRPGGVFRVIVPDCARFCAAYVSKSASDWKALGWDLHKMPGDIFTPMHILNHTFHQGGEHLFGYDFETLKYLLAKAGFTRIDQMSFGKSLDAELAIDQSHHAPYSLYVDASR